MVIDADIMKLFAGTDKFQQVLFLDNFHERIDIDLFEGKVIEDFLFGVANTGDIYIKRAAIILLGDLYIMDKATNIYRFLGLLKEVIDKENDSFLVATSLRYFILVSPSYDDKIIGLLKDLTDNDNADIASESFYSLGIIELAEIDNQSSIEGFINALQHAKKYFLEAAAVVENRTDALFISAVISFLEATISNDIAQASEKLQRVKEIFIARQIYELEVVYVEFDFMFYRIIEKIAAILNRLSKTGEWIEYKTELLQIIRINKQIEKLKSTEGKNAIVYNKVYNSAMVHVLDIAYGINLKNDKRRIEIINIEGYNTELIDFSNYLLTLLPNTGKGIDDMQLFATLISIYGKDGALELYNKIKDDPSKIVEAIQNAQKSNETSISHFVTGSLNGHNIYHSLKLSLKEKLPSYPIDKFETFFAVVEELIRYVLMSISGSSKSDFLFLYSSEEGGKGQLAIENDLQDHLFNKLKFTKLAYGFEHEKAKFVDGGRVDIVFKTDLITIPIELKKSSNQVTIQRIESDYMAQAQTYVSGHDQIGIFVLLDLSDNPSQVNPNIKDLFNIHHLAPSSGLTIGHPDYVISIVIPGNKRLPSSKSKYT